MALNSPSPIAEAILDASDRDSTSFIRACDELKEQGNDHFRSSQWNEALVAYQSALGHLPKRKDQALQSGSNDPDEGDSEAVVQDAEPVLPSDDQSQLDAVAKRRAVLNANIGACFVKLAEHKQAVDACSQALLDDPHYIKALQRRAASNEILGSWSSLTAAQEDYNTLIKLLPPSSSQSRDVQRSLMLLKPRLESAQKQETAEMLGKLKGLGNSILGNFGLSTDNFKFEPNGQGGYSLNFQR
ncbi:Tetratricopeptide repeat protein 1 [Termitomyces sp. T112]|nr:Tetratricopeptide repeat protein 1 [Termitomyces sp. T112]